MKTYNISQKAFGLGDAVVGLYAISALAKTYPNAEINYYTRFVNWLHWWRGFNLKNMYQVETIDTINLWENYETEKLQSTNRKQWYCDQIEMGLVPEKPQLDLPTFIRDIREPLHKNYVVLAPFATTAIRTWPMGNWLYLVNLIKSTGLEVIIIDGPGDGKRHEFFPCQRYWGQKPEVVYNLLYYAKAIVANDSGIAHIGGLLDKPTVGITVQFQPENIFSHTDIMPVTTNIGCAGCQFDSSKGYSNYCEMGCWVLNTITPLAVFDTLLKF